MMHHSGANVPRECGVTSPPLSCPGLTGFGSDKDGGFRFALPTLRPRRPPAPIVNL